MWYDRTIQKPAKERTMPSSPTSVTTNPTIFLRLKQTDPAPREFAWHEFHTRYAPIIAGFARRLGGQPQDIEDVVQDVLLGFFAKAPTFMYDPGKGRFRSYLKVCTYRALQKRIGKNIKLQGKPLDDVDPEAVAVDQVWNDVWERQLLRRAMDEVRESMGQTKTFMAFEQYVVLDQPAQQVAEKLDMHLNSVYRSKEQVTQLLQEKVSLMREED
jgi:RNA polymerase sigma factor (sigma-70 family)